MENRSENFWTRYGSVLVNRDPGQLALLICQALDSFGWSREDRHHLLTNLRELIDTRARCAPNWLLMIAPCPQPVWGGQRQLAPLGRLRMARDV